MKIIEIRTIDKRLGLQWTSGPGTIHAQGHQDAKSHQPGWDTAFAA
jgi:hypothetical protein